LNQDIKRAYCCFFKTSNQVLYDGASSHCVQTQTSIDVGEAQTKTSRNSRTDMPSRYQLFLIILTTIIAKGFLIWHI